PAERAPGGAAAGLLAALGPLPAAAQQPAPRVPPALADTGPFSPLPLPPGNQIRTGAGAPGPKYWQQRADYVINARLDTVAKAVVGEERITYTNNSPDTLRYLWLQLDQNAFAPGSRGALLFPDNPRFGSRKAPGGVRLDAVAEPERRARKGRRAEPPEPLHYLVNGTMMRVDLGRPLPPGGRQRLDIAWSFPLGVTENRMGLEEVDGGTIYEVAQWYPRLAVYDDVRGWNTAQYYGQGEFYLEYGRFDVSLTVPANMLVAATGTLRNPGEVLTAAQRARLARARASGTTVVIRGLDEIGDPASRPASREGTLTWRFTADSVRDFAWAAARHFVWDAVGVNGGKTVAMSFYPPSADSIWNRATEYAKLAIERYSRQWAPYPYPVAVNVNGIEGGMEYPMIVFCHNRTDPQGLYGVTDHEFGHTWFPMMVGNNERLYGWMDEGFNTFMNHYNWAQQYPEAPNRRASADAYLAAATGGLEQPVMTAADRMRTPDAWRNGLYNKPGLALVYLREWVLGPERFDPAFREYIRRWAFRHPTPADFFRTMEDAGGEDLSWFWRGWFYTTATLDQAVDSIVVPRAKAPGETLVSRVYLRNAGGMVMPVDLALLREDGSTERLRLPADIWMHGDRFTLSVRGDAQVTNAAIDPDAALPDVRRENNRWPAMAPQP
ncbi:MAG TPA: M1 family metallopeptidase, partial [Gemmatimonadales bacterium]|nr:M1 family metallopeptidase [Gemmatimonadales bacterium]